MNTPCQLERLLSLVSCPVVPLGAAIVLALATPGNAAPTGMIGDVALSTTAATQPSGAVDDYQPPNNGGPGTSGGSGTRWH